jgi:hypothetical protein
VYEIYGCDVLCGEGSETLIAYMGVKVEKYNGKMDLIQINCKSLNRIELIHSP